MLNDDFTNELDKYIEKLEKCEYISEREVKLLCTKAKEQLSKDENVIYLESPITVSNIFRLLVISFLPI
jgi:serine/threonine-protein phosphatase 4 catalytic subunit